uniref:Death domain-containing protein n=1 Tax=Amphimedon queenslandica TaxID=400682 RepID=A0A1X7TXW7_AMPQE
MASSSSKTISWAFYERTLTIEDLDPVIKLLERHRYSKASYHELGLRLKLSQNTLEKIKSDHGEVDPCFREGIDNAAADGIKEERHETSTTDPTCHPDATIEQRAIHILHDESVNKKLLNLNGPCLIVRLLQKEGILNEESVTEVLGSDLLLKRYILFIQIHRAICKDHKSLLVFARLLCVTTGDENLGKEIEIQYSAADIKFDDKCITNPNEDPLPCLAKVETISIVLKNAESITEVKDIMSSLGLGDVITWYTFKNGKAVGSISPHLATFVIDAIEKSNIKELIESIEVGYYSYDQTRCNELYQNLVGMIKNELQDNFEDQFFDERTSYDEIYQKLVEKIDDFDKKSTELQSSKQELCRDIEKLEEKID